MKKNGLEIKLIEGNFAICKLEANEKIPEWIASDNFFSITRTSEELSIVCHDKDIPENI